MVYICVIALHLNRGEIAQENPFIKAIEKGEKTGPSCGSIRFLGAVGRAIVEKVFVPTDHLNFRLLNRIALPCSSTFENMILLFFFKVGYEKPFPGEWVAIVLD